MYNSGTHLEFTMYLPKFPFMFLVIYIKKAYFASSTARLLISTHELS